MKGINIASDVLMKNANVKNIDDLLLSQQGNLNVSNDEVIIPDEVGLEPLAESEGNSEVKILASEDSQEVEVEEGNY